MKNIKKILLLSIFIVVFIASCMSLSPIENTIYTYTIDFELEQCIANTSQLGYTTITIENGNSKDTIICYPQTGENSDIIPIESLAAKIESSIQNDFTSYGEYAFPVNGVAYENTTVTIADPDNEGLDNTTTTATITLKPKDNYVFQSIYGEVRSFTIKLDLEAIDGATFVPGDGSTT